MESGRTKNQFILVVFLSDLCNKKGPQSARSAPDASAPAQLKDKRLTLDTSKDANSGQHSVRSPKTETPLSSSPKTDWKEVKSKKSKTRSRAATLESSETTTTTKRDGQTQRDKDADALADNTELEFQFDEELNTSQWTNGRKNQFTDWSDDEDSDYEISDTEVAQIIVITQSLSSAGTRLTKHEGYDRTGDWTTRVKMTQELAHVINDGLFYYEQDLWGLNDKHDNKPHKTIELISQEAFEKYSPNQKPKVKGVPPPPPPPPPPTYQEESYIEKYSSGELLLGLYPLY